MALTADEKRRLDVLEHGVGVLIGFALGGPAGARFGNAAVSAHQASPITELQKSLLFSTLPERGIEGADLLGARGSSATGFPLPPMKKKRRANAAAKRYGKCFKKIQHKYKKKNGSWKKDGFKRCAAAARRMSKK
jgi:hypothetical protein